MGNNNTYYLHSTILPRSLTFHILFILTAALQVKLVTSIVTPYLLILKLSLLNISFSKMLEPSEMVRGQ